MKWHKHVYIQACELFQPLTIGFELVPHLNLYA